MTKLSVTLLATMLAFHALGQGSNDVARRPPRQAAEKSGHERQAHHGGKRDQQGDAARALRNPEVAARLGLTEAQREAIDEGVARLKKGHLALRSQMEKAAMKQARLMTAKKLDEDALMAAVEATGKLHTQQAKLRIRHLLFIRRTLTPEQSKMLQRMIQERRGSHKEGGRGRFERGRPGEKGSREHGSAQPGEDDAEPRQKRPRRSAREHGSTTE
jgi:Spy/CpxP family protein refolding chaperone